VRYNDRKEFLYEPEVFKRYDTKTALQIHDEYIRKYSAKPPPKFLEIDRRASGIDPLWHAPIGDRTPIGREINMPAINTFTKPDWRLTKIGITPKRIDQFWLSNNALQEADYFPMRGDLVDWNGYRYMIEKVVLDPSVYWQQTNVWLGLVVECLIPPEGDARPLGNSSLVVPAEASPEPIQTVTVKPMPPFEHHKIGKQGL
jgi:hypothetical protein